MNYEKLISNLTVDCVNEEQRQLIDCIGIENYKKIVLEFGGQYIYFPKAETISKELRDREIIEQFDGINYRNLANKYNLSVVQVRRIINKSLNK